MRIWIFNLVLVIMLAGCSDVPIQTPTQMPVPTSTEIGYITGTGTITNQTILFSGPSNLDFNRIHSLGAGSKVTVKGIYGDFLLVEDPNTNISGYVYKLNLANDGAEITELNIDMVPFISKNILEDIKNPFAIKIDQSVVITPKIDDWGSTLSSIRLSQDTEITIQFSAEQKAAITLHSLPPNKKWGGDWRIGERSFIISETNGEYLLEIFDGISIEDHVYPLWDISTNPITIKFDDPQAKSVISSFR